jgi:oligopeptidase A
VSAFNTGIALNAGLWRHIKDFAGHRSGIANGRTPPVPAENDRHIRRHGADLDAAGKQRLEEIDVELTKVTTKFGENVLDSTNAFEFVVTNEADLAGLPPPP